MASDPGPIPVEQDDGLIPVALESHIEPVFLSAEYNNYKYLVPPTDSSYGSLQDDSGETELQRADRKWWQITLVWVTLVAVAALGIVLAVGLGVGLRQTRAGPGTSASQSQTKTMSGPATAVTNYVYPTAVSWGTGRLEVMALGYNASIAWKYSDEDGNWTPQGSADPEVLTSKTTVWEQGANVLVDTDAEILHMFASGPSDNHYSIFHKWHGTNMSWYPSDDTWEDLNSLVTTNVETVLSQSEIYMFCLDIKAELFYSTYSKDMNPGSWKRIGEASETWALYTPVVVSWTAGRFDVFVVNLETSEVMWRYYDRVWNDQFESLDGFSTSRPAGISTVTGTIDLFTRGGDQGLWWLSYTEGSWSNWTHISGDVTIKGAVDVVSSDQGVIDLFAWGTDASMLHKHYEDQRWTPGEGFEVLGHGLAGPPRALDEEGRVLVFAYDEDKNLVHRWRDEGGAGWNPRDGYEYLGKVP